MRTILAAFVFALSLSGCGGDASDESWVSKPSADQVPKDASFGDPEEMVQAARSANYACNDYLQSISREGEAGGCRDNDDRFLVFSSASEARNWAESHSSDSKVLTGANWAIECDSNCWGLKMIFGGELLQP